MKKFMIALRIERVSPLSGTPNGCLPGLLSLN